MMFAIKLDVQTRATWAVFLTACLVVLTPLLMYSDDMWDGIIVRYAFESHQPEIFQTWFFEAGSPLGSAVYTAAYWLFGHWGINHKLLLNSVMFAAVMACGWQLYHLGRGVFGFSHHAAIAGALIYIVNPSWHILVSSVFFTLVLWNFFALGGLRMLLLGESSLVRGIGGAMLLVSLHYAANPAWVLPVLCFAFIGLGKLKQDWFGFAWVLLGFVYFYLFRTAFPANALYGGYNQITTEHVLNWSLYGQFVEFVITYYWPLLLLLVAPLLKLKVATDRVKLVLQLLFFIALMAVSVFPFVVVDKVVSAPYDWSNRVTVNLTIAIAFTTGFFIHCIESSGLAWLRKIGFALVAITCAMLTIHVYQGYSDKIRALMYQHYYIDALKRQVNQNISNESLAPGLVFTKNLSFFAPDSYELNYYFYQAFGKAAWFVNLADDVKMAELMTANQAYRDKYVASDFSHQCSYRMSQKDNIANASYEELWRFFLNPQGFLATNETIDFNLQFAKRGCAESEPLDRVLATNPLSDNKALVQADISQCSRFDFTKGQWRIAEPLVFPQSCAVRFLKDAELLFAEGSYMVISGEVYSPESGHATFTSMSDSGSWGGVLLTSTQANIQRIKVSKAVGFAYQQQHYPAAVNFVGNENSSIYYSEFIDNQVAVFVTDTKTRIQESVFTANGLGLMLDKVNGALVHNVFEQQLQQAIKFNDSQNMMLMRNMILTSQGVGVSVEGQSKINAYYNWYQGNRVGAAMTEAAYLTIEGDVFSQNGLGLEAKLTTELLARQFNGQVKSLENQRQLLLQSSDGSAIDLGQSEIFLQTTSDNVSVWIQNNFKNCQVCISRVKNPGLMGEK